MRDRQITNILLAIIAGVLLFGSAAVTGAIQWVAIIGGALLALYIVIRLASFFMRESAKSIHDAKSKSREAFLLTVLGLVLMAFLPVVFGYGLLLWFDGVPDPMRAVSESLVGTIFLSIMVVSFVAVGLSFLYTRRADIIPALRYALSLLIRSPLAPVFLSIYGWRKARTAGDGVISSSSTALLGFLVGLVFYAIVAGIIGSSFGH